MTATMDARQVFTIGHSNHQRDRFLALLDDHGIETLVDIRRYPSSRRWPHFNGPALATTLEHQRIDYVWLEALGGHRTNPLDNSPNTRLRDASFRNYADHMLGQEFQEAIDRLLDLAGVKRTVIMCAERSFHDCHRRLTSDFLLARGVSVYHVLATGELEPHTLTRGAKVHVAGVTYPEYRPLFDAVDGGQPG